MAELLKRVATTFPSPVRHELKRHYYAWQIRRGTFRTSEPEFDLLEQLVKPGDWVVDVGANVGHYTARLSRLVGPTGRVLAFEPVPSTFELLAANARGFPYRNVSLFNAALAETSHLANMQVPEGAEGPYLAHLSGQDTGLKVLCLSFDGLQLRFPVNLVKIDAEGHELSVLRGMERTLVRDRPTLIVEVSSGESEGYLRQLGYIAERLSGSPNWIFRPGVPNAGAE